jgi:membrane-associated phospholipid phosphatase
MKHLAYLIVVLGAAVIILIGLLALLAPSSWEGFTRRWNAWGPVAASFGWYGRLRSSLTDSMGRATAFVVLILATIPPVVLMVWALGEVGVHRPIDRMASLFDWFARQKALMPSLVHPMHLVSKLAEWPETFGVAAGGAVLFALMARRNRWLPPLLVVLSVALARYLQKVSGTLVHERHPPTSLGTYPSGGATRVLAVYAFIVFLFLALRGRRDRALSVVLWTGIALLAWLVGFARAYLLLHWPVDILGGWVLGASLLAAQVGAANVFIRTGTVGVGPEGPGPKPDRSATGRR